MSVRTHTTKVVDTQRTKETKKANDSPQLFPKDIKGTAGGFLFQAANHLLRTETTTIKQLEQLLADKNNNLLKEHTPVLHQKLQEKLQQKRELSRQAQQLVDNPNTTLSDIDNFIAKNKLQLPAEKIKLLINKQKLILQTKIMTLMANRNKTYKDITLFIKTNLQHLSELLPQSLTALITQQALNLLQHGSSDEIQDFIQTCGEKLEPPMLENLNNRQFSQKIQELLQHGSAQEISVFMQDEHNFVKLTEAQRAYLLNKVHVQ